MAKTIIDKIWESHVVSAKASGAPDILTIDFMLLHEVTSIQAFDLLKGRNIPLLDPSRLVATLDHSIPTRKNRLEIYDDAARTQVEALRSVCAEHGLILFDFGSGYQGIVHVIGPELGLTQPGMTIVCGDSHTSTHGAFGALAFGVGTSEVGHVLATGSILQRRPKTMRVEFAGTFAAGVYAKDAVLKLIAEIGIGGANGHVIEYTGQAVRAMSMEERMTVCNMSIECGARAGLVSPDDTTIKFLKGRRYAPKDNDWERAESYWRSLSSDEGARYDREIRIDVSTLSPMVTWGTNPEQAIPVSGTVPRINELPESHRTVAAQAMAYTRLSEGQSISGVKVDWAFVGSCTNGRIEDLRVAAEVLRGKKVHDDVTLYIVPGSESVMAQAHQEGLVDLFRAAGADFRMPGCSMCLGMNDDKVPAGKRCISTSNRNFIGRQGEGSITHLASPATVAASAIAGVITTYSDV
ncbi:MAG: 3-isopropylmalate dehydratase large subunit [Pseudomonadota bacterium]|jgi:3-isopropylmalate/(R)-2-methylmalate dehydratase large subunit